MWLADIPHHTSCRAGCIGFCCAVFGFLTDQCLAWDGEMVLSRENSDSSVISNLVLTSGSSSSILMNRWQASSRASKSASESFWTTGILYGFKSKSFFKMFLTDSRFTPLSKLIALTDLVGVSRTIFSIEWIFSSDLAVLGRPAKIRKTQWIVSSYLLLHHLGH